MDGFPLLAGLDERDEPVARRPGGRGLPQIRQGVGIHDGVGVEGLDGPVQQPGVKAPAAVSVAGQALPVPAGQQPGMEPQGQGADRGGVHVGRQVRPVPPDAGKLHGVADVTPRARQHGSRAGMVDAGELQGSEGAHEGVGVWHAHERCGQRVVLAGPHALVGHRPVQEGEAVVYRTAHLGADRFRAGFLDAHLGSRNAPM